MKENSFEYPLDYLLPPRPVPLAVQGHLLTSWPVLFGSAFLSVGSIFALTVGSETDLLGTLLLNNNCEVAPGWLEGVVKTRYSENEGRVYRYVYSFRDLTGAIQSGASYSNGREFSYLDPIVEVDHTRPPNIKVEFSPANSRRNRIVGTRTSLCSPFVLFVWLFPPIGLMFLLGGLVFGLRQIRLLKHGVLTRIRFRSSDRSGGLARLRWTPKTGRPDKV